MLNLLNKESFRDSDMESIYQDECIWIFKDRIRTEKWLWENYAYTNEDLMLATTTSSSKNNKEVPRLNEIARRNCPEGHLKVRYNIGQKKGTRLINQSGLLEKSQELAFANTVTSVEGKTIRDAHVYISLSCMEKGGNYDPKLFYVAVSRNTRLDDLFLIDFNNHFAELTARRISS